MLRRVSVIGFSLVLLFACGGGGKKESSSSSASSSGTTTAPPTTAPPPIAPLTGLVGDRATLARPALVVKIDNADGGGVNSARPQLGINEADIVYEEMVEGSVTRLAAIFHSTDSDPVGPVRSARTTDISVFSPLNRPLFAWSGANADFAELIRNSPLIDVGYGVASDAYERRSEGGHVAPHNLYTSTSALFALAPSDAVAPHPLWQFLPPGGALSPTAAPVGSIHLEFGGGGGAAPVDWSWATYGFARNQKGTPDVDEKGVQVTAQNVLVLFVDYVNTGYVDVSGSPVPEAQLVGTGPCWLLTQNKITNCLWSKTSPEAITTYTDATGGQLLFTPGRTWVELVPNGGGTVTG